MKLLTDWLSLNFPIPCTAVKFMWKFPVPSKGILCI